METVIQISQPHGRKFNLAFELVPQGGRQEHASSNKCLSFPGLPKEKRKQSSTYFPIYKFVAP